MPSERPDLLARPILHGMRHTRVVEFTACTKSRPKCRENQEPDIPLVPADNSGNTYFAMSTAILPQISVVRSAISAISAIKDVSEMTLRARTDIHRRMKYPIYWVRMWGVARSVQKVLGRLESASFDIKTAARSAKGFYARPPECDELLQQVLGLRADVVESSGYDDAVSSIFPRQVARLRKAKSGILEHCDNLIAAIPKDDPAARATARVQHGSGQLVDFEKFFNDLQGVQH